MPPAKGLLFGAALGDAIGLVTKFTPRGTITEIKFPYKYPIRGWGANDWTDATDQMILLFEMMSEQVFETKTYRQAQVIFAKKLKYWVEQGFPLLGDKRGEMCNGSTLSIITNPEFTHNPELVTKSFWEGCGRSVASNGSLMRCAVLAYTQNYIVNTINM